MGRAEGIVHVDVRQRGQSPSKFRVVLLFLSMEAQILEHQYAARLQVLDGIIRPGANAVARKVHMAPQDLRQAIGNRPEAQGRINFAIRPTKVRAENYPSVVSEQVLNGWNGGTNARVVANLPVTQGHVEVNANKHPLAAHMASLTVSFLVTKQC